jgi:hypothetical protein
MLGGKGLQENRAPIPHIAALSPEARLQLQFEMVDPSIACACDHLGLV